MNSLLPVFAFLHRILLSFAARSFRTILTVKKTTTAIGISKNDHEQLIVDWSQILTAVFLTQGWEYYFRPGDRQHYCHEGGNYDPCLLLGTVLFVPNGPNHSAVAIQADSDGQPVSNK